MTYCKEMGYMKPHTRIRSGGGTTFFQGRDDQFGKKNIKMSNLPGGWGSRDGGNQDAHLFCVKMYADITYFLEIFHCPSVLPIYVTV